MWLFNLYGSYKTLTLSKSEVLICSTYVSVCRFEVTCSVGLKLDHVTFISVLAAYSHTGEVELKLRYLNATNKSCGLEPEKEHYGCVVDLLGRAVRIMRLS